MHLENLSRQTLQSALKAVRRRSFLQSYLLVLWPDSERVLLEMARRLGGEVLVPGGTNSLLTASLGAGIKKFDHHRKQDGYNPRTWASNVYLHFWQGAVETAAQVMSFKAHAATGIWNPAELPFLDWRSEHPGEIEWEYRPVVRPATGTEEPILHNLEAISYGYVFSGQSARFAMIISNIKTTRSKMSNIPPPS